MSQYIRANRFFHRFRTGLLRRCGKLTWAPRGTMPNNTRGQKPMRTGQLSRSQLAYLIVRFGHVDVRQHVRMA